MAEELREKIMLFIAIETNCSEIYSSLNCLCPERETLWNYLSKVEENHATVSYIAKSYHMAGKLPEEFMDPSLSIADLTKTLHRTEVLKKRLKNGDIELEESLAEVLAIENEACKEYFRKTLLANAPNSNVMAKLKRVVWDTDAHLEILRDFIKEKECKKDSTE